MLPQLHVGTNLLGCKFGAHIYIYIHVAVNPSIQKEYLKKEHGSPSVSIYLSIYLSISLSTSLNTSKKRPSQHPVAIGTAAGPLCKEKLSDLGIETSCASFLGLAAAKSCGAKQFPSCRRRIRHLERQPI